MKNTKSGNTIRLRLLYYSEQVGKHRLWTGCKTTDGYGRLREGGKTRHAHVLSWELSRKRKVPPGKLVMHRCDIRSCIEPRCLKLGTTKQNLDDMRAKGRARYRYGLNHQWGKKTAQEVIQIRADPRNNRTIARETGMSEAWVSMVRRGLLRQKLEVI